MIITISGTEQVLAFGSHVNHNKVKRRYGNDIFGSKDILKINSNIKISSYGKKK